MVPVLEAVDSSPGEPLVEQVPLVVVPHKAVRVIHQARDGLDVIGLPIVGAADFLVQGPKLLRILERAVSFFACPVFHKCSSSLIVYFRQSEFWGVVENSVSFGCCPVFLFVLV